MVSAVTVIETPQDGTVVLENRSFTELFDTTIFSFTFEADSIPIDAGGGEAQEVTFDITVPGVELGDFVLISSILDVTDMDLVAYVSAINVVTLQLQNLTGADGTPFDTATAGYIGIVLRLKASVLDELAV